jgi:hypothetical protein
MCVTLVLYRDLVIGDDYKGFSMCILQGSGDEPNMFRMYTLHSNLVMISIKGAGECVTFSGKRKKGGK